MGLTVSRCAPANVATDQRRAPRQTVAPVITQRRELGQVELLAVCDRRAKILPVWLYTGVIIQESAMAERITLDFRRIACCSGPCNQTAPLRESEPGQCRWDGLMYAGHTHTLYVLRGYQCSGCNKRYREFWEAFDWAVDNKDFDAMFSIEEHFENDARAISQKFAVLRARIQSSKCAGAENRHPEQQVRSC